VRAHGIGVHKPDEILKFGQEDLKVLSELLADKPFFFGDEPSLVSIYFHIRKIVGYFLVRGKRKYSYVSSFCQGNVMGPGASKGKLLSLSHRQICMAFTCVWPYHITSYLFNGGPVETGKFVVICNRPREVVNLTLPHTLISQTNGTFAGLATVVLFRYELMRAESTVTLCNTYFFILLTVKSFFV